MFYMTRDQIFPCCLPAFLKVNKAQKIIYLSRGVHRDDNGMPRIHF